MKPGRILKRSRKVLTVARVIAGEKGIPRSAWYVLGAGVEGFAWLIVDTGLVLYSTASRKPLVHMIGDSHSKTFRRKLPFVVHHIGAATAHNLKKKDNSTKSNEKLFDTLDRIRKKDVVVLLFGELDCRIHAYRQFRKNEERQTMGQILDLTISNYGEVISQIKDLGMSPCICSVAPATTVGNEHNFPFYASPEVRCEITRTFNGKLEGLCRDNGYVYLDVCTKVCDENGVVLPEYLADDTHLNSDAVNVMRTELSAKLGIRI